MQHDVVKCTNCGKISKREHLLPLCSDCFTGLEDYEDFIKKSTNDVHISIDKNPGPGDNFLQV